MARPPSSFTNLFMRQTLRTFHNPNHQFRNIGTNGRSEVFLNQDKLQNLSEVVKEICGTIRSTPRWENTLLSDFKGVNFLDSSFLNQVLRHQNNAFLSIRLLNWLSSTFEFSPEPSTCSLIFNELVKDNAAKAAKSFLQITKFVPEPASLESYVRCLCESRMIEEALKVMDELKKMGSYPVLETWNCILLGSIKVGRTDIVWQLYGEMIENGVVTNVETVDYLIQAFCIDKNVSKGYELLRQVLEDGYIPHKVAFGKLIFGFIKDGKYDRVSALLHIMIEKGVDLDIYTYQQIVHGLCMINMQPEGLRIFNDLKNRGYAPDSIMYTTMIHGFCKRKWLGHARKLWFEMIQKGFKPNQYTNNTLIDGYFKCGYITKALNLYKEMSDRGYTETTVTYNIMIRGLCLHGRTGEAFELFQKMVQQGVAHDVITYNSLIRGFCKKGKLAKGLKLLNELLEQDFLQPSSASYRFLIEKLCEMGQVVKAKTLWKGMQDRGVEPDSCINDYMIIGLIKSGYVAEGINWLANMVKNGHIPQRETFEELIHILAQKDKLDDVLIVRGYMLKIGYTPTKRRKPKLLKNFQRKSSRLRRIKLYKRTPARLTSRSC